MCVTLTNHQRYSSCWIYDVVAAAVVVAVAVVAVGIDPNDTPVSFCIDR